MDEPATKNERETIGDIDLTDFLRRENRLRVVGVLSPIAAFITELTEIDKDELVIGREKRADLTIDDNSVSRRHARICRVGTDFVLEDLGSSHGTYVEGIPIVSCVLHSGDII